MQPTIADILELPVVQAGAPEVVCDGSLDQPVRWVHVSDLPDLSDLLQGGELVLTTGPALTEIGAGGRYLEGLAAAGAVGLVLELGVHVAEVPADVILAGRSLRFPVIALHRQTRFVAITEAVHRSIVADQYSEVDYARRVHEIFTDLGMRRASLAEIVAAAAGLLEGSVVLEDLNRQVLAFTAVDISTTDLLEEWQRRSRLGGPVDAAGEPIWTITSVGPTGQEWGRLIAPAATAPGQRIRMTLERAAQALALRRMVEQDLTTLELQAQSGLIDELRTGTITDEAEALTRARALGLGSTADYLPLTIRLRRHSTSDQVAAQQLRVRALDAATHAVGVARMTALTAGRRPDQIDVLLAHPTNSSDQDLATLCTGVRTALLRITGIDHCVIGVGSSSHRLLDAARGLAESDHVAEVALSFPESDRPFHRVGDIRLRGLIALIRDDPRVQRFAETELRNILDYQARHDGNDVEILRAFLDVGGNKTELAARLHISRPSLYARLARIEKLLGVSLEDAESRTSLHTALLILDSRHSTGSGEY
ncbi:PucR family transcriptional regulator [Williamsia sp.]|uniref:PucR family transcriptional regulator n=1 Tax=Williamsia sp. TaxID=1872085 RepID=UPI002F93698E